MKNTFESINAEAEQIDYFKIVREHPEQGKRISKSEIDKLIEEKRLKSK